ncbi:hypothetical protein [uncultured Shewanella sp.]|uniref:hypothetical protein n=1 Tax=uncultured Shewanella sp. TaxID=173975 RepID=UPI0026024A68|nr:hypothetical protein [uncultured Shewanella sp.]
MSVKDESAYGPYDPYDHSGNSGISTFLFSTYFQIELTLTRHILYQKAINSIDEHF